MKILLVEDNEVLREMIERFLSGEGWEVESFSEGYGFLEYFYSSKPDLVILDWMLPSISGIELCRELKKINAGIPIIMLTAKSNDEDEIEGFNNGVDEYIRKPFNPKILILRIKSLLGRKRKERIFLNSKIYVDTIQNQVFNEKTPVMLFPKEYELLLYLAENRGRYLSREQLVEYVWGFDFEGDSRTVDSHITNLRKKLDKDLIKTKRGVGYSMVKEDEA